MTDGVPTTTSASETERAGATISPCGRYRYELRRVWDDRLPLSLFVMLNPSTADHREDDHTIKRCRAFAKSWGCGGFVVGNVFAYRSAYPRDLVTASDPVGPLNDETLAELLDEGPGFVVAAWGASYPKVQRGRVRDVRRLLLTRGPAHCLGKTSSGEPRHPLYLPAETPLEAL